ncbi:MAG: EAL domain-containing protein [Chromatiales bacterium]|nr:EAL domain-containing protein [Chromatiales bacterium]
MKISLRPFLGAVVIGMLVLLGAQFLSDIVARDRYQKDKALAEKRLQQVSSALAQSMNARLNLTGSLAAFVTINREFTQQQFDRYASLLQQDLNGIRSLQLAPEGIVKYLTNLESNRSALNHNLLTDPRLQQVIEKSIRERVFIIHGPYTLRQGGVAIVARRPLFLSESDNKPSLFWGFTTVIVEIQPILEDSDFYGLEKDFTLAIRGKDGLGEKGDVFYGDMSTFELPIATANVVLPDASWQLAAKLKPASLPSGFLFSVWYWIVAGFVAFLTAMITYTIINRPRLLRKEVYQATENLRTTLNSIGDGVIATDTAGNITLMNPRAEKITGWHFDMAMSKPLSTVFFTRNGQTKSPRTSPVSRVLETGRSIGSDSQVILTDKTGKEYRIADSAAPIRDDEGTVTGAVLVFRDTTEDYFAQLALKESEEKYRSIFESTVFSMIVVIDGKGNIVEWNAGAEQTFGYTPEEIIGKPITTLMPERFHEAHCRGFECATSQGDLLHKGVRHELVGIKKSGEEFPIELTLGSWQKDGNLYFSAIIIDTTARKSAEGKIRTLFQAIEQSPVSVIITDPHTKIEYVNGAFEQTTGYSAAEMIGKTPKRLVVGQPSKGHYRELWTTISSGQSWQGEFQSRRKSGDLFWEHAHIAPVHDETGAIRHYLAVMEDITLRKMQEESILHQAHFDSLTDLPNRFLALDRLTQLISEAQRSGAMVGVLFLDLDDFKKINDTLGHDMGDNLLIEASRRLRSAVRSGDTIGRLGGDEFIVLLGGLFEAADARPVVNNLLNLFNEPFTVNGRELIVTACIGIAVYPDDGDSPTELLRKADSAMYHAKEQGNNTYSYYTDAMNRSVSRRLAVEEQMHGALDRGEFYLCYQPLVDVKSYSFIGVETLLRWTNPSLGKISPAEFIPIAEQTGLIIPIGQFVLREALRMLAKWQKQALSSLVMAINLSPRQFRDPSLISLIESALEENQISGDSLELEITEGVLMSGHAYIERALYRLNTLGVSIVMDDFGTGYSSLSYLRSYPFDALKIDRSFIDDITIDKADRELVNAAIVMAHSLGLTVVAEGVETPEQLVLLASQNCDFAQGYLFSKPMRAEQISAMLEAGEGFVSPSAESLEALQ